MKKKLSLPQLVRHLIQLAAFLLFPGLFITVFSSIKSLCMAPFTGSVPLAALAYDFAVVLAVLPVTLLWGRFFCGYLCSFGAAAELLGFLGGKVFKRRPRIGKKADRLLKYLKYLVLLAVIIAIWIWNLPLKESWNPWHIFGIYTHPSGYGSGAILGLGGALLLAIFILEFFFERFFCRYLCPLGAIFSLLSRCSLFKIRRREPRCVGCGACDRACPMGNKISTEDIAPKGECIGCMRCVEQCPGKGLHTTYKTGVDGTSAALLMIALYLGLTAIAAKIPVPVSLGPVSGARLENLTDGIYTGTGSGYRGDVAVEVTVSGGEITDITVTSYRDDYRFFVRAQNSIPAAIVANQSLDIAAVTGATFSSNAILEAVSNALGAEFENPNSTLSRGHHHGPSGEMGASRGPSRGMASSEASTEIE